MGEITYTHASMNTVKTEPHCNECFSSPCGCLPPSDPEEEHTDMTPSPSNSHTDGVKFIRDAVTHAQQDVHEANSIQQEETVTSSDKTKEQERSETIIVKRILNRLDEACEELERKAFENR